MQSHYPRAMIMRQADPDKDRGSRTAKLFHRQAPLRRLLRYGGYAILLLMACLVAGFLHFADDVTAMMPPAEPKADAIVVLTGGYQRIDQAVDLLRKGSGRRLLISGVHPSTSPATIRKMTQSSPDLFACCVDMGYRAIDTIGNANETAQWIHDKGFSSVLVVTSNYHMRRSLMELRRTDHETQFIPYPVVTADLRTRAWYADPNALRTLLSEYAKILIAYTRDLGGWDNWQGLRTPGSTSQQSSQS
ncbi:YdcF family protein [Agrobacterium vitis]|uniref:YdcF family protein n=2 Tax=Agrobacterium vitis TaxID=373 RepID=A0A368NQZ3_AGRVI|nr:YdcF family protein [Agrobacterium vitis]KAA3529701.1 YdcF family protein [Agrobacterium vitis]MCE6076001.1 YdcF family protein [Agrobacterium vitis]MCF1467936.1 YdcF family protein [Agrobacterium vitis]MCF1477276.1 YdcF family protein [Agrobacterium vitis]